MLVSDKDTVIVIPSKRTPPLKTISSYPTTRPIILISDPDIQGAHEKWVEENNFTNISVVSGKKGMCKQSAMCYRVAARAGYDYYFRMDDDLTPKFFVSDVGFPTLNEVIVYARTCAELLKVSLAGFANTSRLDWLGYGYETTYGLIHGGAHLARSTEDPSEFIDETLEAYEDVYRSAAHRIKDGAVGRVSFIGLDKTKSLRGSSMNKSPEVIERAKKIILSKFPQAVTCNGVRVLDGGNQIIPNWRLKKHSEFRKEYAWIPLSELTQEKKSIH